MKEAARSTRMARAVWLAGALAASFGSFVGPAARWQSMLTVCHPDSACQGWQLDAGAARMLSLHGLSPLALAVFTVVAGALFWLTWYGLGALIILRRPNDRGALLAAYFLAVLPVWGNTVWLPSSGLTNLTIAGFVGTLLLFGLLFPDGRFAAPWTRWLAGVIVALVVVISFPVFSFASAGGNIVFVGAFASVVAAQVHRYRSVSSWAQRQQTKWSVLGLAVAILGLAAMWTAGNVVPFPTGNGSLWYAVTNMSGMALMLSAIPVCITISILHNHLWDIDRVINRALVYTVFTVLLAGIYIGGVVGLQALFGLLIGGGSTLAIALSTLAIAALFGPLRRRIQAVIDRRFYRRKYDAARTLASFTTRLRDEVDLTHLSEVIISVVSDTMQPAHVSLWLAEDGGEEPG